jgi:hypothetical protein
MREKQAGMPKNLIRPICLKKSVGKPSGKLVRGEVGMSGEVTLRGRVLQVGGIKMKVLAAMECSDWNGVLFDQIFE